MIDDDSTSSNIEDDSDNNSDDNSKDNSSDSDDDSDDSFSSFHSFIHRELERTPDDYNFKGDTVYLNRYDLMHSLQLLD